MAGAIPELGNLGYGLAVGELTVAACTTLRAEPATTLDLTGLLVVLAATHLFLDAAALYQFSESPYRFLNRFAITYQQLNHSLCSNSLVFGKSERGFVL